MTIMLRNGDQAPAFALQTHDGSEVTLEQFAGKPLTIVFFRGKFCGTTKRYLTAYQDFYARIQDMGQELVAITFDTLENITELKNDLKIKFPLLSNPDLDVLKAYGVYIDTRPNGDVYGEPAVVILDNESKVVFSAISSGAKGLPDPGAIAPILIYMSTHEGKY